MRCFLAIFILFATVSDPWFEMLRSEAQAATVEQHFSVDYSASVPVVVSIIVNSHDHGNSPCAEDDCPECHACHLGHCGFLTPKSTVVFQNKLSYMAPVYIERLSSVSLDGLYRPPKFKS